MGGKVRSTAAADGPTSPPLPDEKVGKSTRSITLEEMLPDGVLRTELPKRFSSFKEASHQCPVSHQDITSTDNVKLGIP